VQDVTPDLSLMKMLPNVLMIVNVVTVRLLDVLQHLPHKPNKNVLNVVMAIHLEMGTVFHHATRSACVHLNMLAFLLNKKIECNYKVDVSILKIAFGVLTEIPNNVNQKVLLIVSVRTEHQTHLVVPIQNQPLVYTNVNHVMMVSKTTVQVVSKKDHVNVLMVHC